MKKHFGMYILGSILAFLVFSHPVFAATGDCQPAYGAASGCAQVQDLALDLKVINPQAKTYVDNLNVNDPRFTSADRIDYRITLKNNGKTTMSSIVVRDFFPSMLRFSSGPVS